MKLLACTAAVLLAGCASTSSVARGPNGRPLHHIESVSSAKGYERASNECPAGYDVIHTRQQGVFFVLDIECR